jgi:hypothetical protein
MLAHKFSGKKNIFLIPCKNKNLMLQYDYSQDIVFICIYTCHIKCSLFPKKLLVSKYIMSIFTREIFFWNFLTFYINFKHPLGKRGFGNKLERRDQRTNIQTTVNHEMRLVLEEVRSLFAWSHNTSHHPILLC